MILTKANSLKNNRTYFSQRWCKHFYRFVETADELHQNIWSNSSRYFISLWLELLIQYLKSIRNHESLAQLVQHDTRWILKYFRLCITKLQRTGKLTKSWKIDCGQIPTEIKSPVFSLWNNNFSCVYFHKTNSWFYKKKT